MMKKDVTSQTILSTDTGRSMVEMLGTLAIIGVLSIAGIAGYRYALTKYKAAGSSLCDAGITKRLGRRHSFKRR